MASKNVDKEADEVFQSFDIDGNGTISVKELKKAMKSFGLNPSEKEIADKLKEWDKDDSKTLDKEEFKALLKATQEAEQRAAFDQFDKDKSGYITDAELKEAMKAVGAQLSDKEVKDMIKHADTNEDGKVSFEEFKTMIGGCSK